MSNQSKISKRPSDSKKQLVNLGDGQTALDLLANWVALAQELGLVIDQIYSPTHRRYTVRVNNVVVVDDEIMIDGPAPSDAATD